MKMMEKQIKDGWKVFWLNINKMKLLRINVRQLKGMKCMKIMEKERMKRLTIKERMKKMKIMENME
jgi:hypothetical protein